MVRFLFGFVALLSIVCSAGGSAFAISKRLTVNKKTTLDPIGRFSLTYFLKQEVTLHVVVNELKNQNIKFHVLQDGRVVYKSPVRKGLVKARVTVRKGSVSVVVINNHLLTKKRVMINVLAIYKPSRTWFRRSRYSLILEKHKRVTIKPSMEFVMSYTLKRPSRLFVKVSEAFGRNIEFKVFQNKRQVYQTGVIKGGVTGTIPLKRGRFSVLIKNGNVLLDKTVDYFVAVLR